jgi:hypothetical protein
MRIHRIHGHVQLLTNFFAGETFEHQLQHFPFPDA